MLFTDRKSNTENLLRCSLNSDGEKEFISIINENGKRWLMPKKNMAMAFCLYQPSGAKGKLLKRWLPLLKHIPLANKLLGFQVQSYKLCLELEVLLNSIFENHDLEFSLFCGTPSVHQKITIQLHSGYQILGYCKVTDNQQVKAIFRNEQQVLDVLHKNNVKRVPNCLFNGNLKDDIQIFVQDTSKTKDSKTPHEWHAAHWNFLKELFEKTKEKLAFKETEFSQMLDQFPNRLSSLPVHMGKDIITAMKKISDHFAGRTVSFSIFHGDFTPWNMYDENGQLYVFDWEYARRSYPPYLDAFHFFIQTRIHEQHKTAEEIFHDYRNAENSFSPYLTNPDLMLKCYLVAIIFQYISREEQETINWESHKSMSTWTELLNRLNKHG